MALITTKILFINVLVLLLLTCSGCALEGEPVKHTPQADGGDFVMNDKDLKVNPLNYPVFSVKTSRVAPRANVNPTIGFKGGREPDLLSDYRWQVSHAFAGKYLIYSEEYDRQSCLADAEVRGDRSEAHVQEICNTQLEGSFNSQRGLGAEYRAHIYLKLDGTAYGWQFLHSKKRNPYFFQETLFRIEDSGDWSGQPWFECVERCDKLVNMQEHPVNSGSATAN